MKPLLILLLGLAFSLNAQASAYRSADYSNGYGYQNGRHLMPGASPIVGLDMEQLEYRQPRRGDNYYVADGSLWYGNSLQRLRLGIEAHQRPNQADEQQVSLRYEQAVSAYWDAFIGARYDRLPGDNRQWVALGLQGTAPYFIETELAFYVGKHGRSAAELQLAYDLRLTQRWILQPQLELQWYGKDDDINGIASGVHSLQSGLRLRYEISRQFAPYVGLAYQQYLGDNAQLHDDSLSWVAGVKLWY